MHNQKRREGSPSGATCLKAEKRIYMTRQEARKARQATGSGLSIYRCDDHYHIGHGRGLSREVHRRMRGDE